MGRHFSQVIAESDGDALTITIRCQNCAGGSFTIAAAHLETLARVLPDMARQLGIDLDPTKTQTYVFDGDTPENRAKADALFNTFVKDRKQN